MTAPEDRAKSIFSIALNMEHEERLVYLNQQCGDDSSLRKAVETLLRDSEANAENQQPTATQSETLAPADREDETLPPTSVRETTVSSRRTTTGRFGDYELIDEIARGGMGIVFEARQVSLNRIVALKMILSGQLAGEEDVQRFYAEAEAAANLDHPGIVPIYEVGEYQGQHYFSMALVEGDSLKEKLSDGPLESMESARLLKMVAEAVAHAHEKGVIHRDLKPANVLMGIDNNPRITDFGLAKRLESNHDLTATGQVMGTPSYMPPEQASGKIEEVNETADIYSLGAILYEMITGRPPFQAANPLDTLLQVLENDPVPPRHINDAIDVDIEAICLKCLEKTIGDRYQSARELAKDLDRYLNGETVSAKHSTTINRALRMVLRETRHVEIMALWGRAWIWHSALIFLLLTANNIMMWVGIDSAAVHGTFWLIGIGVIMFVVWWYRFRSGPPLSPIEKQIGPIWLMFAVTAILTGRINHLLGLETMFLLPIVILEAGFAFGAMATILGGSFYPLAVACAIVSLVMAAYPDYGPVIAGILIGSGLFIPGWRYSRPDTFVGTKQ